MKKQSAITFLICCSVVLFFTQCNNSGYVDLKAEEQIIRHSDSTWSAAAQAKDLNAHISYFHDDAVLLSPNEALVSGKDAISKSAAAMFALTGFSIKWVPVSVTVALSGDLAYSRGTYELSMNDGKGATITDKGKYLTIWKKKPDGNWKVSADMFNTDLPVPQPLVN